MPIRGGKMAGVISDSNSNEMSYVDMHDLHPENVQAAQVRGFMEGAASGATLATVPAAILSVGSEKVIEDGVTHAALKAGSIFSAVSGSDGESPLLSRRCVWGSTGGYV